MDKLQEFGLSIIDKVSERIIDFIPENINIENIDEVVNYILNKLNLNIEKFTIKSCKKSNTEGFFMKWHVDDAQVIKHQDCKIFDDQIRISNRKVINYSENRPIFTIIVYLSTINEDFTGGEFEFVNLKVKPIRGMFVFFDSKEVHKVNKVKKGKRDNYLIKLYKNL